MPSGPFGQEFRAAAGPFFELFLAFFFPHIYTDIDWKHDVESLDAEFQKIRPEGETGLRRADRLVKAYGRDNGTDFALIHAEEQCQFEADFAYRSMSSPALRA